MFDKKSNFSLNKANPDAIVCPSVTGVHIQLTREDFDSEEEFLRWKAWSDGDYKGSENAGRGYYDNCIPLTEILKSANTSTDASASAEDVFFVPSLKAEQKEQWAALMQKIKNVLTETQYRRLWMLCVEGKSVNKIAELEGVTFQAVYVSLARAKKAIVNIL